MLHMLQNMVFCTLAHKIDIQGIIGESNWVLISTHSEVQVRTCDRSLVGCSRHFANLNVIQEIHQPGDDFKSWDINMFPEL